LGVFSENEHILSLCAGPLPLSLGRLKAAGCEISIDDGFTFSTDIRGVGDATELDFSSLRLRGEFESLHL
jgi:hypothetical protein